VLQVHVHKGTRINDHKNKEAEQKLDQLQERHLTLSELGRPFPTSKFPEILPLEDAFTTKDQLGKAQPLVYVLVCACVCVCVCVFRARGSSFMLCYVAYVMCVHMHICVCLHVYKYI
jgi:hypothetical protein